MLPRSLLLLLTIVGIFCANPQPDTNLPTRIPNSVRQRYAKSFTNAALNLNVSCRQHSDCYTKYENSNCGLSDVCRCDIGFEPSSLPDNKSAAAKLACVRKRCSKHEECTAFYKTETECSQGMCECPTGYHRRPSSCREMYARLGANCSQFNDCGPQASCGALGRCECKIGAAPWNAVSCYSTVCANTTQCQSVTENSVCADRACVCPHGYHPNPSLTECLAGLSRNDACDNSVQCGVNAFCAPDSKCRCRSGYDASPVDSSQCILVQCDSDRDCRRQDDELRCQYDRRYFIDSCQCRAGFELQHDTQRCVKSGIRWALIAAIAGVLALAAFALGMLLVRIYHRTSAT